MTRLLNLFGDTLSSTMFLSRLPVWRLMNDDARERLPDFRQSAHAFPIAGLLIALPACLIAAFASALNLPTMVIVLLALATTIFCTGALHEDGLADVADGFWGGATKDRKLAIMRDSAIGTYGVLALILVLALKLSTLGALGGIIPITSLVMVFLSVASLSRAAMIFPWVFLSAARPSTSSTVVSNEKDEAGLSARYGEPDHETLLLTTIMALPALIVLVMALGLVPALIALVIGGLFMGAVVLLAKHHIGGHTGDVLGAVQQMSEMGLYLGLLIAI